MTDERLSQIVEFCKLIDKEKFVQRSTYLSDGERLENDAEHAWHMAVMALLLSGYSNEKVDVLKVVSLLLVHDLVEIYAGDTFAYDEEGKKTQREREQAAADRLYSQLPEDLAVKMRALWDEFEEWGSAESKFAHTLDNFQPQGPSSSEVVNHQSGFVISSMDHPRTRFRENGTIPISLIASIMLWSDVNSCDAAFMLQR